MQRTGVRRSVPEARAASMRHPERWLAALRVLVGLWFLKSLFTKIQWTLLLGFLPVPGATPRWVGFLPERLAEYAGGHPIAWYHDFLTGIAIPHAELFAQLTALGEAAVGIGLTFGLFTRVSAAGGLFLALNYGFASFWQGPGAQGFHLVLAGCMLAFLGAHAGRVWGVDGWLAGRLARRRAPSPAPAAGPFGVEAARTEPATPVTHGGEQPSVR